ncbi:MAG: 5-bromo-4-chloroindolyl phosphate hydrolysis family protein [Lachnospiraceae bacterium]|nr:5-bromo-4-chloroindolyl phosphate hydrolysis family protein [Lachnospiraceae bacterium]
MSDMNNNLNNNSQVVNGNGGASGGNSGNGGGAQGNPGRPGGASGPRGNTGAAGGAGYNSNNRTNKSFSGKNVGLELRDGILDAISRGDISGISTTIQSTIDQVLDEVNNQIDRGVSMASSYGSRAAGYANTERARQMHERAEAEIRRNKQLREEAMRKRALRPKFREIGRAGSAMKTLFGSITTIIFGIGIIPALLDGDLTGAIVLAFMALIGLFLFLSGRKGSKMLKTAKRYKELCGSDMYVTVANIASATATPPNKVIENIKKILSKGFFPEGYLDKQETTFMISKEVYNQYLNTQKQAEVANVKAEAPADSASDPKLSGELAVMIEEGNAAIRRLHELNEEIPEEGITDKLNNIEQLLNDIFTRVKDHPELMQSCHKLMDYYLPMMLKLVEAYAEYNKVSQPGAEIITAKAEIEKTLDTIIQAFNELLNRLFRDSVWDIKSDAQVLTTMLKQEGL